MTSTPISTWCLTISATARSTRAEKAAGSTRCPDSFSVIIFKRSSGRGRLPTCVVRNLSVLRRIFAILPSGTLGIHDLGDALLARKGRALPAYHRAEPISRVPRAAPLERTWRGGTGAGIL